MTRTEIANFHANQWLMNARPYDWAVTKTFTKPEYFPRGLVVRIRRSHRRGPGSIPGVGMCFFLLFFKIHCALEWEIEHSISY